MVKVIIIISICYVIISLLVSQLGKFSLFIYHMVFILLYVCSVLDHRRHGKNKKVAHDA